METVSVRPVEIFPRKRPELTGEDRIRLQPGQLLRSERGIVDRVAHDASPQIVADAGGGFEADQFLRLAGRAGDMRRGDDLRQRDEAAVHWRLGAKDVQTGASQGTAVNGVRKCRLVDKRAAGRVDDAGGPFATRQAVCVEQRPVAGRR